MLEINLLPYTINSIAAVLKEGGVPPVKHILSMRAAVITLRRSAKKIKDHHGLMDFFHHFRRAFRTIEAIKDYEFFQDSLVYIHSILSLAEDFSSENPQDIKRALEKHGGPASGNINMNNTSVEFSEEGQIKTISQNIVDILNSLDASLKQKAERAKELTDQKNRQAHAGTIDG